MIRRIFRSRRNHVVALLALVLAFFALIANSGSASAVEYAEIEGSGSTWAYTIVQQWIADVSAAGMQVTFNNNGSSQGRKDFANNVTDFGDSDIPYQGVDPVTHQADASNRPYAYLPVVAGGTAFAYHLVVAGKQVTNLRLAPTTIAEIFTNKITNWDDPAITKDNNGHALPSEPITPVVRSDGSGSTAQFTLWMDNEFPSIWRPYNGASGLTSIYPRKGRQIAANGDDGVMNTVDSAAGVGTIGYVQYSYAVNAHYPVVSVENPAGYFVQPTPDDVAVALTQAQIKGCDDQGNCSPNGLSPAEYLTQDLSKVYTYKDPRNYPLSSYSYMIIPTSASDQRMTVAKRQTLADFLTYSLCTGQTKAGPYGYSPLPLNLVKAAFGQLEKLGPGATPAAVSGVNVKNPSDNLASCNNPTFVKGNLAANHLAQIAPMPEACQKVGEGPCGDAPLATPGHVTTTDPGSTASTGTSTTPTRTGSTGSGTTVTPPNPTVSDPTATEPTSVGQATAVPVTLTAEREGDNRLFGWVSVLELAALVLVPGLYVAWTRRRQGGAQ